MVLFLIPHNKLPSPPKPIIRESKLVLNEKLLERLRKPEKQVEFYQAIQKSMQSAAEYPPKLVQGVSSMINPGNIFFFFLIGANFCFLLHVSLQQIRNKFPSTNQSFSLAKDDENGNLFF